MSISQKPIAIDLFCGVGGLSLGFKDAGFNIIGGFDFDPIHVRTHSHNFPDSISVCADIRDLTGEKVRKLLGLTKRYPVEVVIGGPPCQGFSMMGKRDIEDPRNLLLREFCRLVLELRPKYFVMENVAGLMCGHARKTLATCLRGFRSGGYRWITPIRVLDATQFGVPQRRKRVVVIGYQADLKKPQYPISRAKAVTVKQAIGDLAVLGAKRSLFKSDVYVGKLGKPSHYALGLRTRESKLTGCLRAVHSANVFQRFRSTKQGMTEPISRFARLDESSVSPTLRAGTSRQNGSFTAARPIHPTQPRCITVREAARLHSFPDWFQFHSTQWHGFRQIGNAVPPRLAQAVGRSIRRAVQAQ